ncbi:MAG: hypothetical protein IBX57_00745 [Gammaproteobacteria bacterium]|nr:hypothetical protein [Gammaproteobacteria bacterium]
MDSKLLLVKCITLLYRESELGQNNDSADLCNEVVSSIKLPETSMEVQTGREVIVGLRATLKWMISQCKEGVCDKTQLLQRLRVNTKDDTYLYNAVVDSIQPIGEEDALKSTILSYRKSLKDYLDSQVIKSIITKAYQQANFNTGEVDLKNYVRDVYGQLEKFTHDAGNGKHPSVVDSVNFKESDKMTDLLKKSKEEMSIEGALTTGWKALNRMLGEANGFRRGEEVVVPALQHNFKTGFTLNLFKHFALYNKPYMFDSTKKPLLLHISLENEVKSNLMWLYANLKENETNEPCDLTTVDVDEASKYVIEKMRVNGYEIEMIRLDPGLCNIYDLLDILMKYEADGYEIHALVIDYLSMVDKKGLDRSGPTGTEIRELFRRTRNYCATRGITFVTPHQLSTEAKGLVRQGVENFVQEIANKGYYEGSRQIDQEVDLEIYIHIEKIKGRGSYLTVQRGKHRKPTITKNEDLYFVMPFNDVGGIRDDINGEDTSLKSVGGTSVAESGEAKEWFDL